MALPAEAPGPFVLDLTIKLVEDFKQTALTELARIANEVVGLERAVAEARERAEAEAQARAEEQRMALLAQQERDQRIAELERGIAELERDLRDKERHLQTVSGELHSIKATLGWRLLNTYGKVKYAVLRAFR